MSNDWGSGKSDDQVLNVSYTWGIGFSRRMGESLGFSCRLLYERKGIKKDYVSTYYDEFGNPTTLRSIQGVKFEYTSTVLGLRYHFGKKKRFYGSIGAFAGVLQDAHDFTETYTAQGNPVSYYYAKTDEFKDFDWGINAGVGYKVPVWWKLQLGAEVGGNLGLLDIIRDDVAYEGSWKSFNVWSAVVLTVKF
jgi:hypothetical protein